MLYVRDSHSFALPQEFIRKVKEFLREGEKALVADLSDVHHINTNWIGALAASNAAATRSGGKLVLVHVSPSIERVFRISGLTRIMSMCPDLSSAMELFPSRIN